MLATRDEVPQVMNSKYVGVAVGTSVGLCFGAVFGAAIDIGVGVALGVGVGVAFALAFGAASGAESDAALARKKAIADKPLPHPLGLFERDHHPA